MNKLLIALLIMMNLNATAQIQPVREKPVPTTTADKPVPIETLSDYDVEKDMENGEKVYKGIFTYNDLMKDSSFTWLRQGFNDYQPDAKAMKYLEAHLRSYDIRVFMGTWCSDSHDLIPRFYKVLQGIGFMPMGNLVIGMDRAKNTKAPYMAQVKEYGVKLVPTIILINSAGKEAGRITETADKSIEADMVKIIKKDLKK